MRQAVLHCGVNACALQHRTYLAGLVRIHAVYSCWQLVWIGMHDVVFIFALIASVFEHESQIKASRAPKVGQHSGSRLTTYASLQLFITLLDLCLSFLRRGHANLLCIDLASSPRQRLRATRLSSSSWLTISSSTLTHAPSDNSEPRTILSNLLTCFARCFGRQQIGLTRFCQSPPSGAPYSVRVAGLGLSAPALNAGF